MITEILDQKDGESALVLMDNESQDFIEIYFSGKFEPSESGLQEDTRIELNEYSVKMLIGYLQSWINSQTPKV